MFHQQKSKLKYLLFTSFLTLLISMPSNAWSKLAIEDIMLKTCFLDKNKDSIRSFNDNYISKSKIDAFIKHQMDSLKMPGLSIAFINDDKIVYHNALGVKNNETKEKVDNSTIFDAASISKTVFSFFALKMVDDGLLNLDTPLYTYMEYPDIAHDERYKLITARMVLSHTSGFPNWRYLDDQGNYNPKGKLTIKFEPGTKFQYSGEGYEYLAKVIAHLKGVKKNKLQDIIRTTIFEPLSMKHSSFVWNNYLEKHRAEGHFRGKLNKGYGTSAKDPNFKASYSLQTESKEFSHFLIALINHKIVSKKSYEEMIKIQSVKPATKKTNAQKYGLGIAIEESDLGINYSHGGDNLSNTALYMFNIEKKVGYVFFTNSENKNKFQINLLNFLLTN